MNPLLRDGIFWVAVVCCVVATVAIVRSTVLASPPDQERPAAARHRAVEIAYAVLPALGLAVVLAATWLRIR